MLTSEVGVVCEGQEDRLIGKQTNNTDIRSASRTPQSYCWMVGAVQHFSLLLFLPLEGNGMHSGHGDYSEVSNMTLDKGICNCLSYCYCDKNHNQNIS